MNRQSAFCRGCFRFYDKFQGHTPVLTGSDGLDVLRDPVRFTSNKKLGDLLLQQFCIPIHNF